MKEQIVIDRQRYILCDKSFPRINMLWIGLPEANAEDTLSSRSRFPNLQPGFLVFSVFT